MKNYEKWEKYTLGKIRFIEKTKNYIHRQDFVNFVVTNDISSVIEIGPGEMIEYQRIKRKLPNIEYSIVEVSDLFIRNCNDRFPEVSVIRSPIEEVCEVKKRDIVYISSVLEHSRDVSLFIKKAMELGNLFYFVMFKWTYDGDLKSTYNKKKKYWSSLFNIYQLLSEIQKYGDIVETKIAKGDKFIDFHKYSKGRTGQHRTGDYLIIRGTIK